MKGVYVSVGRGGLQWMLWCHPDLLFVTRLLICPGPPVLVDEDSDQKSSQDLPFTEGDCLHGGSSLRETTHGINVGRIQQPDPLTLIRLTSAGSSLLMSAF